MLLEWRQSLPLSGLHACWCLAQSSAHNAHPIFTRAIYHIGSSPMGADLLAAADRLGAASRDLSGATISNVSEETLWQALFADVATTGQVANEHKQLAAPVSECLSLYASAYSEFEHQIDLRSRPLKEHWEAQGPGLMYGMKHLLPDRAVALSAFLVLPMLGGCGQPHRGDDSFHIEAVLANEYPMLPETLRIAWMLAQATLQPAVKSIESSLLLIPATLTSAVELGITACDERIIALAIDNWVHPISQCLTSTNTRSLAACVSQAFETRLHESDWPSAAASLRQRLAEIPS